jgi:AraC-like DNA-binding protein
MPQAMRIYVHEQLSAERPIKAGRWGVSENTAAQHVHDSLEILWNEKPLLLNLGGEQYELKERQIFIVPPLVPHIAEPLNRTAAIPNAGCHLSILETALQGAPDQPTLKPGLLKPEHFATVMPLVAYLHQRLLKTRGVVTTDLRLLMQGLLALLRDLGYGSSVRPLRNLDPVQRALEELYQRYDEPDLRMEDLAIAADLSLAQFRRVFKHVLGESPLSYLARHRLEQARLLLSQDRFTVAAVARRVGFKSPASFYKRFMKLMPAVRAISRASHCSAKSREPGRRLIRIGPEKSSDLVHWLTS